MKGLAIFAAVCAVAGGFALASADRALVPDVEATATPLPCAGKVAFVNAYGLHSVCVTCENGTHMVPGHTKILGTDIASTCAPDSNAPGAHVLASTQRTATVEQWPIERPPAPTSSPRPGVTPYFSPPPPGYDPAARVGHMIRVDKFGAPIISAQSRDAIVRSVSAAVEKNMRAYLGVERLPPGAREVK